MNSGDTGSTHVLIRPWRSDCRRPDFFQDGSEIGGTRSRKAHTKSRHGCFECKRRKIKCPETLPACVNCKRRGFECTYPPVELDFRDYASLRAQCLLRVEPVFSAVDIRLFHYFITNAYPHHPVGHDAVWVSRVPAISYQYEYLLHAMLALAGSCLTWVSNEDYSTMAISHRLRAIQGINIALSASSRTSEDGDALLAACYALTIQSLFFTDGISEFLTLVRGCGIVSLLLRSDNVDVSFSIDPEYHWKFMESRLDDLPNINVDLFKGSVPSLRRLRPLCEEQKVQMSFCNSLQDCAESINTNSRQAYHIFIILYQNFCNMDDQQFKYFISPRNDVSQLLLAHFLALQIILVPIMERERQGRVIILPIENQVDWLEKIDKEVTPSFRRFLAWPTEVVKYAQTETFHA